MKNTTILRTAPNGTLYHVSQHFSVGDTVAIHNTLTGEVAYTRRVEFLPENEGGLAQVSRPEGGNHELNNLKSALVIKI